MDFLLNSLKMLRQIKEEIRVDIVIFIDFFRTQVLENFHELFQIHVFEVFLKDSSEVFPFLEEDFGGEADDEFDCLVRFEGVRRKQQLLL